MTALQSLAGRLQGALGPASRTVRPEATLAVVALVAAGLLAASQFVDYKAVRAGYSDYGSVSDVVAAPIIGGTRQTAGSAHLYVLLAAAALAAWALASALGGRPERARLVWAVGLAGVAVSLAIDLPQGLDAGSAAIDHADAHASLLAGFWVQLAASGLLVLCGALLLRGLAGSGGSR